MVRGEIIPSLLAEFGEEVNKTINEGDLLFGDFMNLQPLEPEIQVDESYLDLSSYLKVKGKCEEMLNLLEEEKMSDGEGPSLVFFNDAIEHIVRLMRILRLPKRHSMLVGVGGSGKRSIAKLSSFIACSEVFQI